MTDLQRLAALNRIAPGEPHLAPNLDLFLRGPQRHLLDDQIVERLQRNVRGRIACERLAQIDLDQLGLPRLAAVTS